MGFCMEFWSFTNLMMHIIMTWKSILLNNMKNHRYYKERIVSFLTTFELNSNSITQRWIENKFYTLDEERITNFRNKFSMYRIKKANFIPDLAQFSMLLKMCCFLSLSGKKRLKKTAESNKGRGHLKMGSTYQQHRVYRLTFGYFENIYP